LSTNKQLPTTCPSCSQDLAVRQLICDQCETQISGYYALPALMRLNNDDQNFIQSFVLNSGSLKALAKSLGVSYPTVRNRLDDVIERLQSANAQEKESL